MHLRHRTEKFRRAILYFALLLALGLLAFDRTAAYMHRPSQDSRAVVIYTAAWCPFCKNLKAYLRAHDIPYREYDVEKSIQGGMGFWALRGRGVPVAVVGPETIYGFDRKEIDQALVNLGYKLETAQHDEAPEHDTAEGNNASKL